MQIEITKEDAEVLLKAIELWENEPQSDSLTKSLTQLMFAKSEHKDQAIDKFMSNMDKATMEAKARKHHSIIIQAKIYEAIKQEMVNKSKEQKHDHQTN